MCLICIFAVMIVVSFKSQNFLAYIFMLLAVLVYSVSLSPF